LDSWSGLSSFLKTINDNISVDVLLRTIADGGQTKTTSPNKENKYFLLILLSFVDFV